MCFKKHLYYVLMFVIIWTIQLLQNYYILFNPQQDPYSYNLTQTSSNPAFNVLAEFLGFRIQKHGAPFEQVSFSSQNHTSGTLEQSSPPPTVNAATTTFLFISGIMTFTTGIGLTAVRFFEPLFRFLMITKIYEYWGEIYNPKEEEGSSEQEKQVQNDALSSFLSSSLNVELVFILLSSITTFSKKKQEDVDEK